MIDAGFISGESERQRRWAVSICVALAAATLVTGLIGRNRGPNVDAAFAVAAMFWAFSDFLTAFLLLAQSYITGRFNYCFAAAAYIITAVMTMPYLGAYFGLLGTAAKTLGDRQIPAALYIAWHILFPIIILAGVRAHSVRLTERRSKMIVMFASVVLAVALATALTVAIFQFRAFLPHFVIDGVFQPVYSYVGMPAVILANGIGCFSFLLTRRRISSLRLWLGVVMFIFWLDGVLNEFSQIRFSFAWDLGKLMMVFASLIIVERALGDIVRMSALVLKLNATQSDQAAARIRAIWQISTTEGLREDHHMQMVLDVAISHIRPEDDVFAYLSHIEGDMIVVDAASEYGDHATLARSIAAFEPGSRFPAESDVHASLKESGRIVRWHGADGLPPGSRSRAAGWESAIGRSLSGGAREYYLIFGLLESLNRVPFDEFDDAFIDVVGSNLSQLFYHRAQFERLRYQVEHDALTGSLNRTQFSNALRLALRAGSLVAVLVVDIDDFRGMNERVGHLIADELLVEVAARLRNIDDRDVVARLGADEFAVVMHDDPAGRPLSVRLDAYRMAFDRPFHTGDREGTSFRTLSACCGAAEAVAGSSFDELLQRAYVALDESKERGHGHSTVFSSSSEREMRRRRLLLDELESALENDEFFLEYQPTFELNTRIMSGAEALIRWQHPTRGLLPPMEFIEAARRANMLGQITRWVLARIFRDLAGRDLPPSFRCSFNVPSIVLEEDWFIEDLEQSLHEWPNFAAHLSIEITESEIMNHVERAIQTLNGARDLGLLVAIDDFGTGYSSLSYLKRLPIDIVKLDRAFIDGLPDDGKDVALAEMFLSLTRQFSLLSVAEGIETEAQAAWLLAHGCMIGQGFLYSKPLPLSTFCAFLEAERPMLMLEHTSIA